MFQQFLGHWVRLQTLLPALRSLTLKSASCTVWLIEFAVDTLDGDDVEASDSSLWQIITASFHTSLSARRWDHLKHILSSIFDASVRPIDAPDNLICDRSNAVRLRSHNDDKYPLTKLHG